MTRYRMAGDIPLEQVEWWEDPKELARLWRFLRLSNIRPLDPAAFMEEPLVWEREYRMMVSLLDQFPRA